MRSSTAQKQQQQQFKRKRDMVEAEVEGHIDRKSDV